MPEITVNTITVPTTQQIAIRLEQTARLIAPAIALLITCTVLLMQLAYELGYQLGCAIHERNDQLSQLWAQLWHTTAPTTEPLMMAPAKPLEHPLALIADDLMSCSANQVRRITGIKRKASKAQLVAAYLAV